MYLLHRPWKTGAHGGDRHTISDSNGHSDLTPARAAHQIPHKIGTVRTVKTHTRLKKATEDARTAEVLQHTQQHIRLIESVVSD